MAHEGQEIHSPGGMTLRIERIAPELLEMEASYSGEAPMPPEHLHPKQAETFEIVEGRMRAIIGGEERTYETGDRFEVPAGTPHQMAAEVPTRTRWEVRPALRTADFFEGLFGTGPESASELGEKFFEKYADEFRLTSSG